jgi:prolipoprotein diacylglyceryltransferase
MVRYISLLLLVGLAWGQKSPFYLPKIDLFGFDISTWYILGWFNIFSGKIVLIYYGYKKGWDFSKWLTLILFATTGAAIGSLFLPTIVGTLIGFLGCLIFGKRLLGFQHDIGIVIALFIAIVFAIGRIGCLLNGCCFGSVTALPWGINYPIGTPAHWLHLFVDLIPNSHLSSLSIHPIQLYETIFHLFSAILIVKLGKRFKNSNTVLFSYFGSYLIFRFFIEFIRDMNNIWWSALSFGPLSLFQWFLFSIGLGIIICGVILEKTYRPILKKVKTSYSVKNDFIIILGCLVATIIFKNQIQTIHLVQLAIILPMSTFLNLLELRKRYTFFNPIPRYVTASIFAFLFSTPVISQIESRLNDNTLIIPKLQRNNKTWIYTINENNNTLLRIGNRDITFQEFNRRKKLLNLFPNQTVSTLDIYDEMKNNNNSGIQYYGSIGGGRQSFTISGCGDSETSYDVFHISMGIGVEKVNEKAGKQKSYLGIRGNLGISSIQKTSTSTSTSYGGPFGVTPTGTSTSYSSSSYSSVSAILHLYINHNFKNFGFGGGPNFFILSGDIDIFPNLHLRIGPSKFNIQAGISDRYVGVYNPFSAHLSLGFILKNKIPIQMGLMNQYSEFPGATGGFFLQAGNPKGVTLIFGESGGSLALRYNFLK